MDGDRVLAISLEFIDFVVPRRVIEQKYPGGWVACVRDHQNLIGRRVWYDLHLFRDGAMSPADIGLLIEHWEKFGFDTRETVDGKEWWKDVCVIQHLLGGPTLPCSWIEVDLISQTAHLASSDAGLVIGRDNISEAPP